MNNLKWKRDYGDGYETDDSVLWVNGKPTKYVVSPLSSCCFVAMVGSNEIGYFDTRKEAEKELIKRL